MDLLRRLAPSYPCPRVGLRTPASIATCGCRWSRLWAGPCGRRSHAAAAACRPPTTRTRQCPASAASCWCAGCHGGRSLGMKRYWLHVRMRYCTPLNSSRDLSCRLRPSSQRDSKYGSTDCRSSSLTSEPYALRATSPTHTALTSPQPQQSLSAESSGITGSR